MIPELKKIKAKLDRRETSLAQLAVDLGYRSHTSLSAWLKRGKASKIGLSKIREYLKVKK